MSRVLVCGWELPEYAGDTPIEAANYRTWQLVQGLLADNHEVWLAAGRIGGDYPKGTAPVMRSDSLTSVPIRFSAPSWGHQLQEIHDRLRPDCVVGVTFLGALRATRVRTGSPLWVDLYGDPLAEMQAAAHRRRSDRGIATQLGFMRRVLHAGDVFSACGPSQRHALLGQLAMVGRLNSATFGYEFVHVLPASARPRGLVSSLAESEGSTVEPPGFVALWCGGYNTWTDVHTLYRGIEHAMAHQPRLHFVSVGGSLPGCHAYDQFQEFVGRSSYIDRYHLLGWRPVSETPMHYGNAHIGVTLDAPCYEAELGTRTRLAEMMQYGLPIVTTVACDLSREIRDERLGLTFAPGDWQGLGQQLLRLSKDEQVRGEMSERAMHYAATRLSPASTAVVLRQWAAKPTQAPDRPPIGRSSVYSIENSTRALARATVWSLAGIDK